MKKETKRAIRDAFAKLSFRSQAQNPVMLMVYLSACLTTVLLALALAGISDAPWGYIAAICVVLWATVLFGNFAESLAEGRGKAQADALRSAKRDVEACLIDNAALADAATMEDPVGVSCRSRPRGGIGYVEAGAGVPWFARASRCPPTARSSWGRQAWTKARLPANRRRSCARAAAIGRRLPEARRCSPIGW